MSVDQRKNNGAENFFSLQSFGSLATSAFAVSVVCGTTAKIVAHYHYTFDPWLLGVVLSFVIAYTLVGRVARKATEKVLWSQRVVLAVCNGFLIFSQATTLNSVNWSASASETKQSALIPILDPVPWFPPGDHRIAVQDSVAILKDAEAQTASIAVSLTDWSSRVRSRLTDVQKQLEDFADQRAALAKALSVTNNSEERQSLDRKLRDLESKEEDARVRFGNLQTLQRVASDFQTADEQAGGVILGPVRDQVSAAKSDVTSSIARLESTISPTWVFPRRVF